ncbi:TonB-dependent receptor [uncultured Sphingomonas sp.]|uniref:TonB-dependent receptor n=1 Tax=uncultured Sphingomonas sp. TaxID=158754 RepID=UPI0035CAD143
MTAASVLPMAAVAQTAPAQTAPTQTAPIPPARGAAPGDDEADGPDIVVNGRRTQPGAVIGDIKPDQQLSPADIRSYGVSTVADLLNELAPQTTSGRGQGGAPVVLLNGRRISGFSEIRDLPTEAIQRVDILPEEVALKYGYRADQKVVNIVLRRRFRATTLEADDKQATEGGGNSPQGQVDLLNIQRERRFDLHLNYQQTAALTEAQRDILPATAGGAGGGGANGSGAVATVDGTDQRPYRTLQPRSTDFTANAVYARNLFGNAVAASFNGRIESTDSVGTFGLPTVALTVPANSPFSTDGAADTVTRTATGYLPLAQRSSAITSHLGSTFNGDIGQWRWSLTGTYDRTDSKTFTDTGLDPTAYQTQLNAPDPTANPRTGALPGLGALPGNRAFSTSNSGGADVLVNGSLFALPAGSVSTSIRVGASASDFSGNSYRSQTGLAQSSDITRDIVNGQVNIDVPLTSRSKDVLPWIGTLSANLNVAVDHLSDFGTLTTVGYGANWSPIDAIRVLVSITDQGDAPTAQQLGNPLVTTPNQRVFDYVNGTTATVTTTSGGNPALIADNRHVMKLGLTIKPWKAKDVTFTADYNRAHTDNAIASFPAATAAIEGAFPDRFTRGADGTLLRIDTRPVNFARTESSQLRTGVNWSIALKSKIQKEFEAFRNGTGPNPLAGLNFPGRPGGGAPGGGRPGGDGTSPGGGQGAPGAGGPGGGAAGGGGPGGGGFRGGGGGGGGGGFGGRGGQAGGRLQFALYHSWYFTDSVLIRNGLPKLDLLNGDAIGSSGGQSRHLVEAQAGYNNNGLGVRLSANYASGTQVGGDTTGATTGTLNFGGLATANLRLFADLGQRLDLLKAHPWLRGMRIVLSADNLFDSRQRVTDGTGATPVSYQPDYLDPLGRTVKLTVRKLFF